MEDLIIFNGQLEHGEVLMTIIGIGMTIRYKIEQKTWSRIVKTISMMCPLVNEFVKVESKQ